MNANNQGFEASLFHPDFGNEVILGRIFIDRDKLRFVAGNFSDEIAADRVEVTLDKDGDRIYFVDPDRPDLKLFTLDPALLEHPSTKQCQPIWAQLVDKLSRREVSRRVRLTAYFVGVCVLITLLGSWALGVMVRSAARQVPPEWEQKFGDEAMDKVRKRFTVVDDTNRVGRMAVLAAPLIAVLPPGQRGLKFYIVEEEVPNAFALPGGHVVVTTGLLDMVDRPEQLLGVLAHEMAHVTQKHHFRKMASAAGPLILFRVFLHSRSGLMNLLAEGSGLMIVQGFSKEYETEADEVGWDYLAAARIDPHGMIEVFQKLRSYESAMKGVIRLPEAFQSHPAMDKRIAVLEKKAGRLTSTNFVQLEPVDLSGRRLR